MQRRRALHSIKAKLGGAMVAAVMALTACSTAGDASTKAEINANVRSTLQTFDGTVAGGNELRSKAAGVLVFPDVVKGGIGIGGEYGQGALMVGGQIVDYYDIVAGSIGFQLGVQVKSEVILLWTAPPSIISVQAKAGKLALTDRWRLSRSASAAKLTPTR